MEQVQFNVTSLLFGQLTCCVKSNQSPNFTFSIINYENFRLVGKGSQGKWRQYLDCINQLILERLYAVVPIVVMMISIRAFCLLRLWWLSTDNWHLDHPQALSFPKFAYRFSRVSIEMTKQRNIFIQFCRKNLQIQIAISLFKCSFIDSKLLKS